MILDSRSSISVQYVAIEAVDKNGRRAGVLVALHARRSRPAPVDGESAPGKPWRERAGNAAALRLQDSGGLLHWQFVLQAGPGLLLSDGDRAANK